MKRRKFTLMELILVMILLVVMVSMSAPQLGQFFRGRTLGAEARRFMSVSKYASTLASSDGVRVSIELDQVNNEYALIKNEFGEQEVVKRYALPNSVVLEIDPFETVEDELEVNDESVFESDVIGSEELEEDSEDGAELILFSQSGYIIDGSINSVVFTSSNDEEHYIELKMDDTHSRFVIE